MQTLSAPSVPRVGDAAAQVPGAASPVAHRRLPHWAGASLVAGAILLLALLLLARQTALTASPLAVPALPLAFALYAAIAWLLLRGLRLPPTLASFGLPNAVTLFRAVLVCAFAGFVPDLARGSAAGEAAAWAVTALVGVALSLDALDGYLARRLDRASALGARFDMEIDALLILLLALAACLLGKAGPWILLAGAARYLFVAAGAAWPALRRPLAPSWRRKAVCVAVGVLLCALLAPPLQPPVSTGLAAAALALLLWSFGVDTWRQLRGSRSP